MNIAGLPGASVVDETSAEGGVVVMTGVGVGSAGASVVGPAREVVIVVGSSVVEPETVDELGAATLDDVGGETCLLLPDLLHAANTIGAADAARARN